MIHIGPGTDLTRYSHVRYARALLLGSTLVSILAIVYASQLWKAPTAMDIALAQHAEFEELRVIPIPALRGPSRESLVAAYGVPSVLSLFLITLDMALNAYRGENAASGSYPSLVVGVVSSAVLTAGWLAMVVIWGHCAVSDVVSKNEDGWVGVCYQSNLVRYAPGDMRIIGVSPAVGMFLVLSTVLLLVLCLAYLKRTAIDLHTYQTRSPSSKNKIEGDTESESDMPELSSGRSQMV